jgi:hypothetical protein
MAFASLREIVSPGPGILAKFSSFFFSLGLGAVEVIVLFPRCPVVRVVYAIMSRALSKIRTAALPRRGLSREEAAIYLGVSGSTFDELRSLGKIEPPRMIGARKLWDIRELDMAFDALPRENQQTESSSWFDDK